MNDDDTGGGRPAPLRGLRVLDLTTVLAGPYCTYQLGLLGAEVVKVERPGRGDWARLGPKMAAIPEFSAQFVAQNAGKKSITLDLQTEAGLALALRLAAGADILVENFSPGVADRLGIGYDAVRGARPDIVYCALSGYGQDGPLSRRPAYDHVIRAMSGITLLDGTPETVPNRIGPPLFDYLAGMYAAFAVTAALRERDRSGAGQLVDVAMLDACVVAMASTASAWLNGGVEPRANGNTAASGSPASGIFETADGLLSLTANQERQVLRLCAVTGLDGLLDEPRFATAEGRAAHATEFRQRLAGALAGRSAAEWETLLSAAHVPAARVRTIRQTLGEEHLAVRQVQHEPHDPVSGESIFAPTAGFRWNRAALAPRTAPPRLGEHTDELLAGLGLGREQIAELRATQVI